MKKIFTLICLLMTVVLSAQVAFNIDLFAQFNRGDERYSGCWSYIAPDGSEYALIGAKTGTAVYSIDDASDVQELGFIPGPETNWREITVLGEHAYVVTDVQGTGHSMQVIDLSNLPTGISLVTSFSETFQMGHIIQRDIYSEDPYVYVHGVDADDGTHIIDVSDPANPVEVGAYVPGYYIHDGHVKGDYLYAAAFFEDKIDVVDISDKTNPVLVTAIPDPGNNTHSSWLTEDDKYLFVADEQDGVASSIIDIEDLDDPQVVARVLANDLALLHNPYIRGDWAFCSHNTEGLRVYDVADGSLPVEVAYYDTFLGESGGFKGLWSACPYFPSGKIIGADRTEGLFVWTFNNTRAARFYGIVQDGITGELLPNAVVELNGTEILPLNADAEFKHGDLAGDFSLTVSLAGYETEEVSLSLEEGDAESFIVELNPPSVSTEDENDTELIIFPNPAGALTNVHIPESFQFGTLSISNILGQRMQQFQLIGEPVFKLNTEHLTSGTYIVELQNEDNQRVQIKFLKR